MNISIVPNEQIDKEKWDRINWATNSRSAVYNSTPYLDALSPGWEAVVINDYETFVALPKKSKLGLKVYGNPPFLQKLAIIGNGSAEHLDAVEAVIRRLRLVHLSFDAPYFRGIEPRVRNNYFIDLSAAYPELAKRYKSNCKASIKSAGKHGLKVERLEDHTVTFRGFEESFGEVSAYKAAHFDALSLFLDHNRDLFDCYGVLDATGEVVYSAIILEDACRYYYLVSGARPRYRHLLPTYFFMDWFLRQHSGQPGRIFDFEGSDIPAVAFYFQRYGPELEHYYTYYLNNYYFPLKQLLHKKFKQS